MTRRNGNGNRYNYNCLHITGDNYVTNNHYNDFEIAQIHGIRQALFEIMKLPLAEPERLQITQVLDTLVETIHQEHIQAKREAQESRESS